MVRPLSVAPPPRLWRSVSLYCIWAQTEGHIAIKKAAVSAVAVTMRDNLIYDASMERTLGGPFQPFLGTNSQQTAQSLRLILRPRASRSWRDGLARRFRCESSVP